MADYEDNYIQFQVKLENLKEGEAREIVNLLDDVQQDLLIKLEGSTTDWSRARYTDMIKTYEQTLDEVFTKGIMPKLEADGLEFAARTQTAHVRMLKKAIGKKAVINTEPEAQTGAAIVNANMSPAAIYVAATAEPMQGKLMKEWATQLSRKDKAQVSAALRQSWIEGEALGGAVKRIRPILLQTRNAMMAITRTYYGHLAAQTRDIVWKNNDHLVEGIIWDSILDGRTTINICAPRDQLKYTLNGEPIGHNLDYHGGPGQAHWQCRSMSMPLVKGVVRRVDRQAVGAGKNYKRGDNTTRTGRVRTNSAYNRDKGILKESTVKPGQTYSDWLKKQPKAFQDDVLGVAKAKAFRAGTWKLGSKFVPENPVNMRGNPVQFMAFKKQGPIKRGPVRRAPAKAPAKPKPEVYQAPKTQQVTAKGFRPAKSLDAAREYALKNGFAKEVDFGNLDLRAANDMNKALYNHIKKYPEFKNRMDFFGSAQVGEKLIISKYGKDAYKHFTNPLKKAPNAYAYSRKHITFVGKNGLQGGYAQGIYMNERRWSPSNFDTSIKKLQKYVAEGGHPPGTDSIFGITNHELGHQMDDFLRIAQDKKLDEVLGDKFYGFVNATDLQRRQLLSKYADTSFGEFMAEAWAEYTTVKKPRRISQWVGDHLEEKYRNTQFFTSGGESHYGGEAF